MLTALLIVFLVGLVMSVPIALTMLLASLVPGLVGASFAADTAYIVRGIIGGADSTPILAVPLFMLSGIVMARGGISEKLFHVFAYLFGKMRAGLPCTVIITCLFYGAISGSGPATCAAVGSMAIPVLLKMGYEKDFCGAIVGTAGGLGVIIPPSIPFILFGIATGASVGNLFVGGVFPGILIALCLCGYAIFYCARKGEDKDAINAYVGDLRKKGFGRVFLDSFWALLTPVIILGGIYSGAVTPTEAACLSVFYSLIVAFFLYRTICLKDMWAILQESVKSYAPLCLMLALATVLGRVLTLLQLPATISDLPGQPVSVPAGAGHHPADSGNVYGLRAGHYDSGAHAAAGGHGAGNQRDSSWRDHGGEPGGGLYHAALWRQSVCGQPAHRHSGDASGKKGASVYSHLSRGAADDYLHSGAEPGADLGRTKQAAGWKTATWRKCMRGEKAAQGDRQWDKAHGF